MSAIIRRRGLIGADDIPIGYKRAKYLRSSGHQWMSLENIQGQNGIKLSTNMVIRNSSERSPYFIGSASITVTQNIRCYLVGFENNDYVYGYGQSAFVDTGVNFIVGQKTKIDVDFSLGTQTFFVNDVKIKETNYTTPFNNSLCVTVFCLNRRIINEYGQESIEKIQFATADLYDLYAELNGTPMFDWIPLVRVSDNKPGMWNFITKSFEVNRGTGEFGYELLDGTYVAPV